MLENPQIQLWLEEQRRKIQELLRSIGEELDPQSRRAAEAFAFEGQTVLNDEGIRREVAASQQAAAIATGRCLEGGSTIYRIPVKGPLDPNEAEERRRKGREYLAKRNSEMEMLQGKRSRVATKEKDEDTPQSPTFDAFVDEEGKLKIAGPHCPPPPTAEPIQADVAAEMREVERNLALPISAAGESSSSSAWDIGSRYANPFGDEYALERSITPTQPPVPPKIALEELTESFPDDPEISVPGSWTAPETQPEDRDEGSEALSYEEQLAIAMSISEQESSSAPARSSQPEQEEVDMAAAIAASLRDMNVQKDSHTLVDLTPSTPVMTPRRSDWDTLLRSPASGTEQRVQSPSVASSEDLYGATPELTKARLANFNALQGGPSHLPFDPVRDAARTGEIPPTGVRSAFAEVTPTPTLDHEAQGAPSRSGARTPTSHTHSSFGFRSDDTDDFETVASVSTASRAQSQAQSETSGIEVVDVLDDSDVDMLSEEGDGIVTPDSWSEVGSREADSDLEDEDVHRPAPMRL